MQENTTAVYQPWANYYGISTCGGSLPTSLHPTTSTIEKGKAPGFDRNTNTPLATFTTKVLRPSSKSPHDICLARPVHESASFLMKTRKNHRALSATRRIPPESTRQPTRVWCPDSPFFPSPQHSRPPSSSKRQELLFTVFP